MAEVGIIRAGDVAGVWVGCDRGVVGLVAVEGSGVYLAEYPPGTPPPAGSRALGAGGPSLPGHLVLAAARLCPLVPGRPCCREVQPPAACCGRTGRLRRWLAARLAALARWLA